MELFLLLKGLLLGLSIAAPVGPIGILCIRRTLDENRLAGFISGLGAASADAIYASIAAFGLTIITNFIVGQQNIIRLVGGVFLCILGIRAYLSIPIDPAKNYVTNKKQTSNYFTTFFLTLTNPITILSFAAIFSGLGFTESSENTFTSFFIIIGVFSGSALWWLLLSSIVSVFRSKFNILSMKWINRVSGLIILGFGLLAIINHN